MNLSGSQLKSLQDALLDAFPDRDGLARMVRFSLDVKLNAIAEGANQTARIFALLDWAEAQGKLDALIRGAAMSNPGNPQLQRWLKDNAPSLLDKAAEDALSEADIPWVLDRFALHFGQWLQEENWENSQEKWDRYIIGPKPKKLIGRVWYVSTARYASLVSLMR
ncbi:MAG: effector-associated domain EAD1-containing protein [Chloroflexota bacterium]